MTNLISAVLGLSFAAGLNTYATVAGLGLMHRFGWIELPAGLNVLGSTTVISVAAMLYLVEFVADKVPFVDSAWDALHTVVRPGAGALLAYGVVGDVSPEWQIAAMLAGGGVAMASHTAKASTRAAANLSPEPFSNWALSLAEDGLAFFLVWLTAEHPFVALATALLLIAVSVYIIVKFSRFVRRLFRKSA